MPAQPVTPSLPRRQIARILTKLHGESGKTIKDVAEEMDLSYSTVLKMLKGRPCKLRKPDIERIASIYNASADLTESLKSLAAAVNTKAWWSEFGDILLKNFNIFISLEDTATDLLIYENARVPGLLQTEGYSRAWFAINSKIGADEIERHIAVRLRRQTVLTRDHGPTIRFLVDETVIRRVAGSPETMTSQLRHIAYIAALPNVSVRVIPLDAGLYQGIQTGSFIILDFPESEEPVVYVETASQGAMYLEQPAQVAQYREVYADIEQSALSAAKTRALLSKIVKELPR